MTKLKRWLKRLAWLGLLLLLIRLYPHPPLVPDSSLAVLDRQGKLLRLSLASDQQYRLRVPLAGMSSHLREVLFFKEDRWFYWHPGVNPVALVRALRETVSGGTVQGASTITMQLARLKYRLETRSSLGKLAQIFAALWLELCYSKHDILEGYLNLAPYGGNVQGVGAASYIYFGQQASRLSLAQSMALVSIPQAPSRRAPTENAEPASLYRARMRLLKDWLASHDRTDPAQAELLALPLRFERRLPFLAPHFVEYVQRQYPNRATLLSSLDLGLQRQLEQQVQGYLTRRRDSIDNAAALLVHWPSREVQAWVGSADYFNPDIQGQVDGLLAKRSPGSTLKPFIYALAMDQGKVHPQSILKDTPTSFGYFTPENFDGQFLGPISVHDALIRSRNLPAVAVSARLSKPSLYGFLQAAGVRGLRSEQHYGLALALGGGEVSPLELAGLYTGLAQRGLFAPLKFLAAERSEEPPEAQRLLSAPASFMVLDILKDNPRPEEALRSRRTVPVAWKTGTSWGFKDAWTAGVIGEYVLVVWVGHFDGHGDAALVGVQTAAPLFFDLADSLHTQDPPQRQPSPLIKVEVCAASGDLPNADCPKTVPTWFIPGVSPIKLSEVHRRLRIDTRSQRQACPDTPPQFIQEAVYEFWPSDLMRLFTQAGMPRRIPPPAGDCQTPLSAQGQAPEITSPITAVTYLSGQRIPLRAITEAGVQRVFWLVDNALIGTAQAGSVLEWQPERGGEMTIKVIDDQGRSESRKVRVGG
jgi:penicillin-binding protein 1C